MILLSGRIDATLTMSNKLSIAFVLGVVITFITFIYGLGREGTIFLRGLPIPYIIDGSLVGLNFVLDVIIWLIVCLLFLRLLTEFGKSVKNSLLIYGIVLFAVLIFSLTYLISHQYQIVIRPPTG